MTILWIYNLPLNPEAGGTERITSLVAKGLTKLGHNCMGILVFDQASGTMTYDGTPVDDLYNFLKQNHVDVVINQIAYATWLLSAFLTRGGSRWHAEGGKIISCLHFDPKPTSDLYCLKSLRNKGVRDYFNIVKAFLLYPYYRKRQEKRTGEIYNWIYDQSDWFITLSPSHFPYFKQVTRRKEYDRLRAINNPLTFDDISDPSIIDDKKNVMLVCSRMDEYYKRISLVLKSWDRIQTAHQAEGWTLKIVGGGPDLERYRKYAIDHHLQNITFEGCQSPDPYYSEASIFLLTSICEGWGLTLTESLQRGVVPVVMNTCPVYSDIITHGHNGLLTNGSNITDFTRQLLNLLSAPSRLRAMQLNALRSAQKFRIDKTIEQWKQIL